MSADIIPFPRPNRRIVEKDAVVGLLEHQLKLAKEGKLSFVAIAAVNDQGIGYSAWAPDDHIGQQLLTAALGAVGFLNARFYESALAGADETEEPPEAA